MASGGEENETLETDICNCTICLDTFKVPKSLPCLHTFCQSCLSTYILSTKGENSTTDYFLCPICRAKVKPPNPKTPVEEWAKLLPLNQTIATLIDNSAGETLEEKKCDPCRREGELVQAEFWCFECQESLCQFCQKYHKRNKSSSNHKTLPINDLNKDEFQDKMFDIEEPCFEHPDEHLKVYCVDHQKMCCVLCLSIDHRKCENIKTFDQMAESLKKSDETQNLAKTMKTFGQKMEELIIKKQENIEVIEQQKQDILEDVATTIEQAKEKLDKCHEDFKIHVSQTHKEQTTKLVETKDRFEIFQKSIKNCEKMLQTVLKHGSPKQIFITSEKIKACLEVQMEELQELLQKDGDITYNINIDKHLAVINHSMQSIAELKLKKTEGNSSTLSVNDLLWFGSKDVLLQHRLKTASIDDLEAVKLWDIKGDFRYADAVFLKNDDRLLCVDRNNRVLVVYNNAGQLCFPYYVQYTPWGVTQSSDGKIFVSDWTSPGIVIYTLGNQMLQQIRFISTREKPYAIDIVQDNIVVTQQTSVTLFTQNGMQRNKIGRCHENSFVAVSNGDTSYIYCCHGDYVVQYTLDGNEVWRHRLQNIKSARGIALDNAGNIYVCGKDSNNISIISNDGMSNHILSGTDGFPSYSIGFDHTGTKFFLTGNQYGVVIVFGLGIKKWALVGQLDIYSIQHLDTLTQVELTFTNVRAICIADTCL